MVQSKMFTGNVDPFHPALLTDGRLKVEGTGTMDVFRTTKMKQCCRCKFETSGGQSNSNDCRDHDHTFDGRTCELCKACVNIVRESKMHGSNNHASISKLAMETSSVPAPQSGSTAPSALVTTKHADQLQRTRALCVRSCAENHRVTTPGPQCEAVVASPVRGGVS